MRKEKRNNDTSCRRTRYDGAEFAQNLTIDYKCSMIMEQIFNKEQREKAQVIS